MTVVAEPAGPATPSPARLSPLQRTGRIFARPAAAWDDLKDQGQWMFPLLVGLAIFVAVQAFSFDSVTLPMMVDQWDKAVANGQMEPAQAAQAQQAFSGPAARWFIIGPQAFFYVLLVLFQALVVWFGAGFVLGTKFRFRQALDVICWSGFVKIPELLLFYALAWQQGTIQGVHLGLGVLVPEAESPGRLQIGLTTFLDLLGPFSAWWAVVAILGVAALTGAPRRSVAWVLVAIYLAFGVLLAAVSAFFSPGA